MARLEIKPWRRNEPELTADQLTDEEVEFDRKHRDSYARCNVDGNSTKIDGEIPDGTVGVIDGNALTVLGPRGGLRYYPISYTEHFSHGYESTAFNGCIVKYEGGKLYPAAMTQDEYEPFLGRIRTYFRPATMHGIDDRVLPYLADIPTVVAIINKQLEYAKHIRLVACMPVWARRTVAEGVAGKYGVRRGVVLNDQSTGGGAYITYEGIAWLCAFDYSDATGKVFHMPWTLWDQDLNFLQAQFCIREKLNSHHHTGGLQNESLMTWLLGSGQLYASRSLGTGNKMRKITKVLGNVGRAPVNVDMIVKAMKAFAELPDKARQELHNIHFRGTHQYASSTKLYVSHNPLYTDEGARHKDGYLLVIKTKRGQFALPVAALKLKQTQELPLNLARKMQYGETLTLAFDDADSPVTTPNYALQTGSPVSYDFEELGISASTYDAVVQMLKAVGMDDMVNALDEYDREGDEDEYEGDDL